MTLLMLNVALVLVGLPLIIGAMTLIAAVCGCPELLPDPRRPRAARTRTAVWA
ncbi:hypothetical protein AMIS_2250 [Actinoplanes missouriensis 431]|uniref:Uncharacterized protein n=1 Tax=Actinoplanes missouriensis (strain ATCC 14538 / DSM 43046 / CBS 188.64 / JCM 3121 / NBRC 102363 / NCIMB 12654 / NRRL B-3342 / UNCC 431) TaxID=512565 RepID=I0GXF8_ACTM4|nr:hypothetical protein [Actinoplanes missouriensis]BAL85445.1 hypothetical protein AMIS_2250 [Actinoplanes missouriensis 431]